MINKVYSIVVGGGVVAAGNATWGVSIDSPSREIKLKSLYWDVQIYEAISGIPLNLNTQITQRYYLMVGVGGLPLLTNVFGGDVAFPPAIVQNADSIYLNKVGQVRFDSFKVTNLIPIRYLCLNYDLLLAYDHRVTIVAETEENII